MSVQAPRKPVTIDAIRACFALSRRVRSPPPDWLLSDTLYLVKLAQNQPRAFIYGPERAKLADAIRTIHSVLPGLIAEADAEAAKAKVEARATDMDQFALRGRDLLQAAEPFKGMANRRLNPRGNWHGWARMLAMNVRHILERQKPRLGFMPDHPMNHAPWRISFAKETSPGTQIVCKLLVLAGFNDVTPAAVVEVLRTRDKKGG
jgi:hypothetical protein